MQYMVAAANLYAHIYGIPGSRDCAAIRGALEDTPVPSFLPSSKLSDRPITEEDQDRGIGDDGEFWRLLVLLAFVFLTAASKACEPSKGWFHVDATQGPRGPFDAALNPFWFHNLFGFWFCVGCC